MSKLEKSLKEWVTCGIIAPDQAKRIRDHEISKPDNGWTLSGLLILGVVIVSIGVVSLIAANWQGIPDALKLLVDFMLLGILAGWVLRHWDAQKTHPFDSVLLAFMLLCLASIGLIAQIYHTGGQLHHALLLWSCITVGLAAAARHMFVPFVWTGFLLLGLGLAAFDALGMHWASHRSYLALAMTLPLLCAVLTVLSERLPGGGACMRAFAWWMLIGGLAALSFAELYGSARYYAFDFIKDNPLANPYIYVTGYGLAAVTALGLWQSRAHTQTQKIILLLALGTYLLPFHLPMTVIISTIPYTILSMICLSLVALYMASIQQRRLFQGILVLLGFKFLGLYFQALGGLATTGIGLILSGGVVISMAIAWNKYRARFGVWVEGAMG